MTTLNQFRVIILALLLGVVPLVGCSSEPQTSPSQTTTSTEASKSAQSTETSLQVAVSIPPQKYFVEHVGGEYVDVEVMLPPGASPATYKPKPQQLRNLDNTEAYMRIHVPFENAWIDRFRAANQDMTIVDLTKGIDRMPMAGKPNQGKEVANPDPHIWLSPPLVKQQARTIYEALVQLDPEHKQAYQANLESFLAEIEKLDSEIEQTLSGFESRTFMTFHPAWGYFARAYNLEMIPIEVGGSEPSATELSRLIERAKAKNIEVIFAQPQFSKDDAKTIANEIGGEVLLINPVAYEWEENLSEVANTFEEVLGDGG